MALSEQERDNLVAYLDGELDETSARALEARLNTDAALRAEAEALKQAWNMLDYLPTAQPSGSFTHKTMDRLALREPLSTMRMSLPQQQAPAGSQRWQWVAGLLLALGIGLGSAFLIAPLFIPETDPKLEQTLLADLRVIENKPLYDAIDDVRFLNELHRRELFNSPHPMVQPAQANIPTTEERLAQIRRSPDRYRRLLSSANDFLQLPEPERKRLRGLDKQLFGLPKAKREVLLGVMKHYVYWLSGLQPQTRDKIGAAADRTAKLKVIRKLRDAEWIKFLPKAQRAELAGLKEKERLEYIAQRRRERKAWRAKWQLAFNHWPELLRGKPLPAGPRDIGSGRSKGANLVQFVNQYLWPRFSENERQRLREAEEKPWPFYPCTLVDLADNYPSALPGPRGPTNFDQLPEKVLKEFTWSKAFRRKRRMRKPWKDWLDYHMPLTAEAKELIKATGKWPDFAVAVTKLVRKQKLRLSYELWPSTFPELSLTMRGFVKENLEPRLPKDELLDLEQSEENWPAYPQKIQQLADRHGLEVPWQTLPGLRHRWDAYRVKNYELIEQW